MRPTGPIIAVAAVATLVTGCGSSSHPASTTVASSAHSATRTASPRRTAPATQPPSPVTHAPSSVAHAPSSAPRSTERSGATAHHLPVPTSTGDATQVITVVAPSRSSTIAELQAWARVRGGWRRVGPQVPANLGTDGSTDHPSESLSATPVGSFTLTRAFGHDANPGTSLPYTATTPQDWWISQAGPLYNTLQRCDSHCPFTRGDPNEHLFVETPAYDYAVVIDYNTRNAPGGVIQGAGSAFFLHVSEGRPTAGCVSIPATALIRIMRWLRPADHPRIAIAS